MTVLTLDEVCDHLNISTSDHDVELGAILEAAETVIAERVGPLEPTTFTSIVGTSGNGLTLPAKPVISVTSVGANTTADTYGSSDLLVDAQTGAVTTASGYDLPAGRYTVTYVAGWAEDELPASLRLAVKEMVRHLWESQRGGSRRPGSSGQEPVPSYLIPYTVQALIAPHQKFRFGFI